MAPANIDPGYVVGIGKAVRGASVVAEVKLGEITRKVGLRDVVIDTVDTTLQDRKEVLCRVRMGVTPGRTRP